MGFEPTRPFWGLHDFESCAFNRTRPPLPTAEIYRALRAVATAGSSTVPEKGPEDLRAAVREDSPAHLDPVIQFGERRQIDNGAGRAALRVGGPEDDASDARVQCCAEAHGAWLDGRVQGCARQAVGSLAPRAGP